MLSEWLHSKSQQEIKALKEELEQWKVHYNMAADRREEKEDTLKKLMQMNENLCLQVESLLKNLHAAQGICDAVIQKKRGRPCKVKPECK